MSDTSTTPGGLPPEPVENRRNVGSVRPEDYPLKERAGTDSKKPLSEDKEYERLNPGSGGDTPHSPKSGHDRDLA